MRKLNIVSPLDTKLPSLQKSRHFIGISIEPPIVKQKVKFIDLIERPDVWPFSTWGPFLESPEKPFVKLRLAYSVKLVFSYVVTGIKTTAKFRASRCLCFEDTKRIKSLEMRPKGFGTCEK